MANEEEVDGSEVPAGPRIDPLPSWEATGWRWIAALAGLSAGGMFWLAVRESSPPDTRLILDGFANLAIGATLAFFAYRALIKYPFRILDLMGIVITLSLGIKAAIDTMTMLAVNGIIWEGRVTDSDKFSSVMLSCLLTSSALMAGAALGLRYCARIKIEAPVRRLGAIIMGMLAFPAVVGIPVFTLAVLQDAVEILSHSPNMVRTPETEINPLNFVYWVLSIGITGANTVLFLRSMVSSSSVDSMARTAGKNS
ncbi:MAG: hypothetical protein HY291_01280 [Planctomycetes bacterium]|nr:hypothetical protein [Planctomycetota bacterium]